MKGDFSRDTFDAKHHFSRVLMQQGRVQLDADWNEQAAILLHYMQMLAADLIGPYGGPAQVKERTESGLQFEPGSGFELTTVEGKPNDFGLGPGRYYVDGILCENDGADTTYFNQPDYPVTDKLGDLTYLVYIDVWERHITPLEPDGQHIREVALGGPDTATRAKVIWQVKVTDSMPGGASGDGNNIMTDCNSMRQRWPAWVAGWQADSACQLKVRLKPDQPNVDPCIQSPTSAYRGPENQLYRVEIHAGGQLNDPKTQPTFKWSRDNGSIAAAWLDNTDDGGLLVSSARSFEAGQWVEITSEAQDLLGQPGGFYKIARVEGGALYLATSPTWEKDVPKKIRRWDQTETESVHLVQGAVPITEDPTGAAWIDLEDGLQVQFQPNGHYRTGDYWLIPARTAGAIEWPAELDAQGNSVAVAQSPYGIVHHYAPLWFISVAGGTVSIDPANDLRCMFTPAGVCLPA